MSKMKFDVDAISVDEVGRVVLTDESLRILELACDVVTAGGTNEYGDCGVNNVPECASSDGAFCDPAPNVDPECTDGTYCAPSNFFWCS